MNRLFTGLVIVWFWAMGTSPSIAQTSTQAPEVILLNLMSSIRGNDYDAMLALGGERFRAAFTRERFEDLVSRMAVRVRNGYTATYLTSLSQQGHRRHLWKVVFKDDGDDALGSVVLGEDGVRGFGLR